MKGPFIVELCVSTFRGMSIGGEHYYGKLHVHSKCDKHGRHVIGARYWQHPYSGTNLDRVLGADEAAYLREKDGDSSYPIEGSVTGRFNSREDVIAAGKAAFDELFDEKDLLVMEDRKTYGFKAIAGLAADTYNEQPLKMKYQWLEVNGFDQDKDWDHNAPTFAPVEAFTV